MKKNAIYIFLGILLTAMVGFTGCSGVSEEEIAELDALRSEVKSLNTEVNSLKSEKTSIEKEIAEKNAKLDECAKLKAETQKNLKAISQ